MRPSTGLIDANRPLSPLSSLLFRARGIDANTARRALVSSFGAEVTQHLKYKALINRVQADVAAALAAADTSFGEEEVGSYVQGRI
jgi:hypothetical protein